MANFIIERVETGYIEMLHLYQNMPMAARIEPVVLNNWSAKDILAHIASWVWRCAALLEAAHRSDGPLKAQPDVEGLNREFFQQRRNWDWMQVELDFCRAHSALIKAIRQLPSERLNEALVQQTIARATWEHYAEHISSLKHCCEKSMQNLIA